jgi:hypothetical protein
MAPPNLPETWQKLLGGYDSTQSDSGLTSAVAVVFNAVSFEVDGSQLVLRDDDGQEVTRLDTKQLVWWGALDG